MTSGKRPKKNNSISSEDCSVGYMLKSESTFSVYIFKVNIGSQMDKISQAGPSVPSASCKIHPRVID